MILELFPVPIPEQPDLSDLTGLECLSQQEPIDDLETLQLHVAQLTGVVEFLLRRIERLENDD